MYEMRIANDNRKYSTLVSVQCVLVGSIVKVRCMLLLRVSQWELYNLSVRERLVSPDCTMSERECSAKLSMAAMPSQHAIVADSTTEHSEWPSSHRERLNGLTSFSRRYHS